MENNNNSELDNLFSDLEEELGNLEAGKNIEKISLSRELEGFASCFPEWDLHPVR